MGLCSARGEWVRLGGSGLGIVEPSIFSFFFWRAVGLFQGGLTQGLAFLSSLPHSLPFHFGVLSHELDRWTGEGSGLSAGWGAYGRAGFWCRPVSRSRQMRESAGR